MSLEKKRKVTIPEEKHEQNHRVVTILIANADNPAW